MWALHPLLVPQSRQKPHSVIGHEKSQAQSKMRRNENQPHTVQLTGSTEESKKSSGIFLVKTDGKREADRARARRKKGPNFLPTSPMFLPSACCQLGTGPASLLQGQENKISSSAGWPHSPPPPFFPPISAAQTPSPSFGIHGE